MMAATRDMTAVRMRRAVAFSACLFLPLLKVGFRIRQAQGGHALKVFFTFVTFRSAQLSVKKPLVASRLFDLRRELPIRGLFRDDSFRAKAKAGCTYRRRKIFHNECYAHTGRVRSAERRHAQHSFIASSGSGAHSML